MISDKSCTISFKYEFEQNREYNVRTMSEHKKKEIKKKKQRR